MEITTEIRATIPYPPSVNKYWRTVYSKKVNPRTGNKKKSVIKTKESANYIFSVTLLLRSLKLPRITGERFRLELTIFPPDNKKRDIDNICKAVLDVLQCAGIYQDDFSVYQLYVERKEVRPKGEIEFVLKTLLI